MSAANAYANAHDRHRGLCGNILYGEIYWEIKAATPDQIEAAAKTSPCAKDKLVQPKAVVSASLDLHGGRIWSVGDLSVVKKFCADEEYAQVQADAARKAVLKAEESQW